MTFWFTFWLWVASFVITDYFRQRLPNQTPAGLGDFRVPTATEGRYVPLCFGTMVIQGPNVIWYGDFQAEERTVETGIIFKNDETIGFTYFMGMQLGLIRGRTAGIRRIWIGDDVVWDYTVDNGGVLGTVCDVSKPDLFGGTDQGGGFIGRFRLFDGSPSQGQSTYLALSKHGITNLPNYRGFSHLVLTNLSEDGGANIGEANSLRQMKFEIQTYDTVANGGLGDVLSLGNDHHFIGDDLNPISLAYDIFTNTDWGRGLSPSDLNLTNFQAAAETIWNDGLGFSVVIDNVRTTADVLDTIEQHVDGYIGPNPITGQIEVVLARQDYDITASPEEVFFADETNVISVTKFSRGENNQTFNEVLIQYLDRAKNYGDTYAPAQDLANLAIQGRPRSKTSRMEGVHTASVANKIAWRDLRGLSRSLASATVELNRTAWNLRPGNVIVLTDDEVGITSVPMRITAVRQGDPVNASIVLDVVEDIFGNENPGVPEPPGSEFTPPTQEVLPLAPTEGFAIDAPFRIIREDQALGSGSNASPRIYTAVRTGAGGNMVEYEIRVDSPKGGISPEFQSEGFIGGGKMVAGVLRNTEQGWQSGNGTHTIQVDPIGSPVATGALDQLIDTYGPGGFGALDGLCVIDPGGANEEWIITTEIVDDLGGIRLENVWRGALDSAQKDHSAGELIWFIWTGGSGITGRSFGTGDTFEVKLLPRSQTDAISLTDSPEPISQADDTFLGTFDRAVRPEAIASLSMNGTVFPTGDVDFDNIIDGGGGPDLLGILATNQFKPYFSSSDILLQVQGLFETGSPMGPSDFTVPDYELEWWLFNLDETPNPTRGVDEILSSAGTVPVTQQNFQSNLLKDSVSPQPEANSFNARIEMQVSFSPYGGGPRTNNPSEDLIFDFTAVGIFVVPLESAYFHLKADGEDQSDRIFDSTVNRHVIGPIARPRLDTSVSFFGGSSLRVDRTTSWAVNQAQGITIPGEGAISGIWNPNDDHTIQMRVLFPEVVSQDGTIIGQWQSADLSWKWYMNRVGTQAIQFEFYYSTNGSTQNIVTVVGSPQWSPSPMYNTWHTLEFVKKSLSGGDLLLQVYAEGALLGSATITEPSIYTPSPIIPIDIGLHQSLATPGTPFNANIDELRMVKGLALHLVDYTPDATEYDATRDENIFQSDFEGHPGQNSPTEGAGNLGSDPLELTWLYNVSNSVQITHPSFETVTGKACLENDGTFEAGVEVPSSGVDSRHRFLNNDFTVEGWIRFKALPSTKGSGMFLCGVWTDSGNGREWGLGFDENDDLEFLCSFNGTTTAGELNSFTATMPESPKLEIDRWYHIAATRNGDELNLYLDGTRILQDSAAFIDQTDGSPGVSASLGPATQFAALSIAKLAEDESSSNEQSRALNGYVDHTRIINGRALHTGSSISLASPFGREEFWDDDRDTSTNPARDTGVQYTDILMHIHFNDDDRLAFSPEGSGAVDYGTFEETVSLVGSAVVEAISPEPTFGGSMLRCRNTSPLGYATMTQQTTTADQIGEYRDFTLECRVRFDGDPGTAAMTFLSSWDDNVNNRGWYWQLNNNRMEFHWATSGSSEDADSPVFAPWNPAGDTDYHIACVRDQGVIRFYVDGVELTSSPELTDNLENILHPSTDFGIGAWFGASSAPQDVLHGWIYEPRIIKDFAIFDATFTPATRDYGYHRTIAHLGTDDESYRFAEIFDQSRFGLTLAGGGTSGRDAYGPRFADGIAKFGPNAVDLTGAASYVPFEPVSGETLLAGDEFTIEGWCNWDTLDPFSVSVQTFAAHEAGNSTVSWAARLFPTYFEFRWSTDGTAVSTAVWPVTSPQPLVQSQWHHIAFVRDNLASPSVIRLFIDGVEQTPGSPDNVIGGDVLFDNSTSTNREIVFGERRAAAVDEIRAWCEDWRVIREALYRTNFTPRTERIQIVDIPD